MNPMNKLASEYDCWFDSPEGQIIFAIERRAIQELGNIGQGRWLEVGVGTGRFAAALAVTDGVDPSEKALEFAQRRGLRTTVGVAEHLPFADAEFDGALMITTLCFLNEPRLAFRECHRVLKKKAPFIIAMIPSTSPWGRLNIEKGRKGHPFYSTATFYTGEEAVALVSEAGFQLVDARSCLLSTPGEPVSDLIQSGLNENAGFVVMRFERTDE